MVGGAARAEDDPLAKLRQIMAARTAGNTAYIEWDVHRRTSNAGEFSLFYVTERAGETVLQVNLGNEEGVHPLAKKGLHAFLEERGRLEEEDQYWFRMKTAQPQYALLYEGNVWQKEGEMPKARVQPLERRVDCPPIELDRLGMQPSWWELGVDDNEWGIPNEWTRDWDGKARYSTTRAGERETLRMEFDLKEGHTIRMEWELDDERGGQPLRSTVFFDERWVHESRTRLEQMDGRWFPAQVDYYFAPADNPELPYATVRVRNASFDEPWHRQEPFTPDDIGIGLGHTIAVYGRSAPMKWDGTQLITHQEAFDLINLWGIDPDPRFVEATCALSGMTQEQYFERLNEGRARVRAEYEQKHGASFVAPLGKMLKVEGEDPWDRYVREFIEKHKLTGKDVERAHGLRDRCKGLRDWYLYRHQEEWEAAKNKQDAKRLAALERPVQYIFERKLKVGLRKLLPKDADASPRSAAQP